MREIVDFDSAKKKKRDGEGMINFRVLQTNNNFISVRHSDARMLSQLLLWLIMARQSVDGAATTNRLEIEIVEVFSSIKIKL